MINCIELIACMYIAPHKIKAATVFVLAIGIGIGVPLLSRLQARDGQASLVSLQQPQSSPPPAASISCLATPQSVYVGDQVTWTIQTTNVPLPDQLTYIWTGAVTGQGQT